VLIGSENRFHEEHILAALQANKHVFTEKPVATTIESCESILSAFTQSDCLLSVGFTLRYSPHYRKIKQLIDAGAIGQIVSLEFNESLKVGHGSWIMSCWRRFAENSGGHMLEKCCHDVDIVNWFLDSRAIKVASFGGLNVFKPENINLYERLEKAENKLNPYKDFNRKLPENPFLSEKTVNDNQVAILEYENGVRATFHTNLNCGIPERRMYICGTEGAIRSDVMSGLIQLNKIGSSEGLQDVSTSSFGGHGGGDDVLGGEVADCMLKGTLPAAGLNDGITAAVTCLEIDRARAACQVIDLQKTWKQLRIV